VGQDSIQFVAKIFRQNRVCQGRPAHERPFKTVL
jgi:hypothetical protein